MTRRDENGQAIVEFAIVMPLALFVTLGLLQLALLFVARGLLNYATYMSARAVLVGEDPQAAAQCIMSPVSGPTSLGGATTPTLLPGWGELPRSRASSEKTKATVVDPLAADSDHVTVEVKHEYELMFPEFVLPLVGVPGPTFRSYFQNGSSFLTLTDTCTLAKPWPGM
ncbi:MAG: TadE family protein [Planctomycetota bacterium]